MEEKGENQEKVLQKFNLLINQKKMKKLEVKLKKMSLLFKAT